MGAYCRYCDHRCFVLRTLTNGQTICLATCPAGMVHDRRAVGQDHRTALNPITRRRDATPDARALALLGDTGATNLRSVIYLGMIDSLANRGVIASPELDEFFGRPEVYQVGSRARQLYV